MDDNATGPVTGDTFSWDLPALASALHLTEDDARNYFRDGRRSSFLLEQRIKDAFPGWKMAPSATASYDLMDQDGGLWEVRVLTQSIFFCSNSMVGKGRNFDASAFLARLDTLRGYIVPDVSSFPDVQLYVISSDRIRQLFETGCLGHTTRVSRGQFISLFTHAS